jgi:hypothetical protein
MVSANTAMSSNGFRLAVTLRRLRRFNGSVAMNRAMDSGLLKISKSIKVSIRMDCGNEPG